MGWLDFFKKFRLADIKNNLRIGQAGIINYHVENYNYTFHVSNPEEVKKITELEITPELETEFDERVREKLAPKKDTLNALPEKSMEKYVVSTSIATATQMATGVFHTYPWEGEYANEIIGEADINIVVTGEKPLKKKDPYKRDPSGENGSPMDF
jgi:hypothetical protein